MIFFHPYKSSALLYACSNCLLLFNIYLQIGAAQEANGISGYPVIYESNRRHVTEEEKARALQLANAARTEGSCVVVMRPSHVYKAFYLVNNTCCETFNSFMFRMFTVGLDQYCIRDTML